MVLPRKLPADGVDSAQVFFIKRLFHKALYYSGPLEPVANVIFLIPIYFFLVVIPKRKRPIFVLWVCLFISASAEIAQEFIPGRVISIGDFALNSVGSATAFIIYKFRLRSIAEE